VPNELFCNEGTGNATSSPPLLCQSLRRAVLATPPIRAAS